MKKEQSNKLPLAVKYCLMHNLFTPKELEVLKQDPKKLNAASIAKMDLHLTHNHR